MENKFFVHGGWNVDPLSDMNVLDWESKNWSKLELPEAPSARRWHTLTQMQGNSKQFLLYGGYDGDFKVLRDDMHILDLENQRWIAQSAKGSIPVAGRCRHSMTPFGSKQMVLIGGITANKRHSDSIHILHTDNMQWTMVQNTGPFFPC